jgi:hypothetical protein
MSRAPLEPSREQARQWAVEELSRREYAAAQPGLTERLLRWLGDRLSDLLGALDGVSSPSSAIAVGVLLALAFGAIGYAVWRFGGPGRLRAAAHADPLFDSATPTTAVQHRAEADRAEAGGDWDRAVLERFRALVRSLEEHTVLAPRPGRTAGEVCVEAARALPGLDDRLHSAAGVFDEVRYGGHPARAESAHLLRSVDEEVDRALRAGQAVLT